METDYKITTKKFEKKVILLLHKSKIFQVFVFQEVKNLVKNVKKNQTLKIKGLKGEMLKREFLVFFM